MAPPLTARTYSTYRYNLRKRPSTQNNNNTRAVSFNDIFSSDDETRPNTSKKSKKSRDKTFKPPTPDSSSSESSDSSSSSDESDNNNDEL
uniref:Uncharacterized protein n=1 Tax=Panagrolaimus davidi TaxID=227884 RepID=A0A914P673_9BILA